MGDIGRPSDDAGDDGRPSDDGVRRLAERDLGDVYAVINAAAGRYRGAVPDAADTTPYLPRAELEDAFDEMTCYGIDQDDLVGVVGLQERSDVSLIRHLYVRPDAQRDGLGTRLVEAAIEQADATTILVGTWAAADWAVDCYASNGFDSVDDTARLLETYWDVPAHQREASVVLRYERDG